VLCLWLTGGLHQLSLACAHLALYASDGNDQRICICGFGGEKAYSKSHGFHPASLTTCLEGAWCKLRDVKCFAYNDLRDGCYERCLSGVERRLLICKVDARSVKPAPMK
jgi:hypothetical protein